MTTSPIRPERALDFADLAYAVDGDPLTLPDPLAGAGWRPWDSTEFNGLILDADTGLKGATLTNGDTVLVAFAGTEGAQDAFADLGLGWAQWDRAREQLPALYRDLPAEVRQVHFVGHSLGGALAQYAAYEFVLDQQQELVSSDIAVGATTFNALGGAAGLLQNLPEARPGAWFDPLLLDAQEANFRHYILGGDLVSRLGDGHVGGAVLRVPDPRHPPGATLDLVTAHTVTTLRQLGSELGGFGAAVATAVDYLQVDRLQERVANFGGLLNVSGEAGEVEGVLRTVSAVSSQLGMLVAAPLDPAARQMEGFLKAIFGNLHNAVNLPDPIRQGFGALQAVPVYAAVLQRLALSQAALAVSGATLTLAVLSDVLEVSLDTLVGFSGLPPELVERLDLTDEALAAIGGLVGVAGQLRRAFLPQGDVFQAGNRAQLFAEPVPEGLAGPLHITLEAPVPEATYLLLEVGDPGRLTLAGPAHGAEVRPTGRADRFLVRVPQGQATVTVDAITVADDNNHDDWVEVRYLGLPWLDFQPVFEGAPMGATSVRIADRIDAAGRLQLTGTAGNDTGPGALVGSDAAEILDGLAGDDTLEGRDGDDRLLGGPGNDALLGGVGADQLFGDEGDDRLTAGPGADALYGGPGLDLLAGGAGGDRLDGGAGDDILLGGDGNDLIDAGLGDDNVLADARVTLPGPGAWVLREQRPDGGIALRFEGLQALPGLAPGDDIIDAGPGDDVVFAGGGADVVAAGAGDDFVVGEAGDDFLAGDDGNDILHGDDRDDPAATGDDSLSGGAGDDELVGGGGNDRLLGGDGSDLLLGDDPLHPALAGDDWLDGGTGADRLQGGPGDDFLLGAAGADVLLGDDPIADPLRHGDDWLDGGSGDDLLVGGGGHDRLYGGAGDDELQGDIDALAVLLHGDDILDGGAGNDRLFGDGGMDVLLGGDGDDYLDGGDGDDSLEGGHGHDVLLGGHGDDRLNSGPGDDRLLGGHGDDRLDGSAGADLLSGGGGQDRLDGGTGNDSLDGGDGDDWLRGGPGDDRLAGGAGQDALAGDGGDDHLDGGGGADRLSGGNGNDWLDGGAGVDLLRGGAGDDRLVGGTGNDLLDGGTGDDRYLFDAGHGLDRVRDSGGNDRLQLTPPAAEAVLVSQRLGRDLGLWFAGTSDRVLVEDWFAETAARIETIDVVGGASFTADALTAAAQTLDGGPGDDVLRGWDDSDDQLSGGDGDDRLLGLAGNDRLDGGPGADALLAGPGEDLLIGGPGIDTYVVGLGRTVIADGGPAGEMGIVQLEAGLTRADLGASIHGEDLLLGIDGGASVRISGYTANASDWQFQLGSGRAFDIQQLLAPGSGDAAWLAGEIDRFEQGHHARLLAAAAAANASGSGIHAPLAVPIIVQSFGDANKLDSVIVDGRRWYPDVPGSFVGSDWRWAATPPTARSHTMLEVADLVANPGAPEQQLPASGQIDVVWREAGLVLRNGVLAGDSPVSERTLVELVWEPAEVAAAGLTARLPVIEQRQQLQRVTGSEAAERIIAGPDALLLAEGGGGDDELVAGAARNVLLAGGPGDDSLQGGVHDDVLIGGEGNDRLAGGEGADRYVFGAGEAGIDLVLDTGVFTRGDLVAQVSGEFGLPAGIASLETAREADIPAIIAHLGGGTPDPRYAADAVDVVLVNLPRAAVSLDWTLAAGRQALALRWGPDRGVDIALRRHGLDRVGAGIEQVMFTDGTVPVATLLATLASPPPPLPQLAAAAPGDIELNGTAGPDYLIAAADGTRINGGHGDDGLEGGAGDDTLRGGAGHDRLYGGPGRDQLSGQDGDDRLAGGAGPDSLSGGAGADRLVGGSGDDQLIGGPGDDWLDGGDGDDRYLFLPGDGHDVIRDSGGQDRIVLLGDGAAAAQMPGIAREGDDLVVRPGPDASIRVQDWFADSRARIEVLEWPAAETEPGAGGEPETGEGGEGPAPPGQLLAADMEALALAANRAPLVIGPPLPAQHVVPATAAGWQAPVGVFRDPDPGDSLRFSLRRQDGTALPAGMLFEPTNGTLATGGALPPGHRLRLTLTARDRQGAEASVPLQLVSPLLGFTAADRRPVVVEPAAAFVAQAEALQAALAGGSAAGAGAGLPTLLPAGDPGMSLAASLPI